MDIDWGVLYDAISHPIAILDSNQNVVSANKALISILQKSENEIKGLKCWNIFHNHSTNHPAHNCPFNEMRKDNFTHTSEMVVEALDGTFLVTCTPVYDKNGEIDKVIHIATDISERKKYEEQILMNEEHLKFITSNINDIIWELTPDFVFKFVAGNVERLTGFTVEEMMGKSLFEIMEPRSRERFLAELESGKNIPMEQRANSRLRYELEFLNKDGSSFWSEIIPSFHLDENGNLLGFQGITRDITERKNYEFSILESEKRLSDIIDFLPDPTFAIDKDGKVIAWNRAIEKLSGTSKDLVLGTAGRSYSIFLLGKPSAMLIDYYLDPSSIDKSDYVNFHIFDDSVVGEVTVVNPENNEELHFLGKASPLMDSNSNIIGAIESIREISDIRFAQKELYENKLKIDELNKMLRLILDSAPVHIFWKDKELRYKGCNQQFASDYGFGSPDDLIGLTDFDFCPANVAEYYQELDLKILESGLPMLNLEEPPNRPISKGNWLKTSRVPLKDEFGNIFGILIIHEDITEIKQTQEEIKKATERLKLVFDATNDGIWDWDLINNKVYFSERYYTMMGYRPFEFEASLAAWMDMLHPEDKQKTINMVDKHIYELSSDFNVEFRFRMKNGDYKWINGRGKVVERDPHGRPTRMIGTHVDISERKKNEQEIVKLNNTLKELNLDLEKMVEQRTAELKKTLHQLEDSNDELRLMNEQATADAHRILQLNQDLMTSEAQLKNALAAKDKFFSMMAHELKTPFSGFLLLSDMMAKDFDDLSVNDMKKMAKTINESANSLYNLLESLLQWARLQLGEIPFTYEKLDLYEITINTIYFFNSKAKEKNIEIINNVPKNSLVTCDRNMITSVYRNLISNSIKFSNPDDVIEIGAQLDEQNNAIECYVKDNGVGIADSALEKIFNIDTHYATKGTNNESGSGLGLAFCKEFLERHKGNIDIQSAVGKGTIVKFVIPVSEQ